MTPENVEKIRLNLIDYITGTVDEWLRIAHFDQTPEDRDGIQYRIAWQHPDEGRMIANVSETPNGQPLVRFGVSIDVSPLHAGADGACPGYGSTFDPCPAGCALGACVANRPALGPENDLGIYGIDDRADEPICTPERRLDHGHTIACGPMNQDAGVAYCLSCRGAGCDDCRQVGSWREPEKGHRSFAPREIRPPEKAPVWMPATFLMCLSGDRIRIGETESDVLRSTSGIWNANTRDAWHPTPWKHTELRMDLSANPGLRQYPPNTPCEILMAPERYDVHLFMQTFPGSVITSSHVD